MPAATADTMNMADRSSSNKNHSATSSGSSGPGRDHYVHQHNARGERGSPLQGSTPTTSTSSAPIYHQSAAPPGHGFKRAATVSDTAGLRRRSTIGATASAGGEGLGGGGGGVGDVGVNATHHYGDRRRDSAMSDFSGLDILSTQPDDPIPLSSHPKTSNWHFIPLAFALLPAAGGLMFKNGHVFVTDFLLLGLAAVFLQWSITQPWNWYHSAQVIRVCEEAAVEIALDEDNKSDSHDDEEEEDRSNGDDSRSQSPSSRARAGKGPPPKRIESAGPRREKKPSRDPQHAALRELYFHEVTALLACFVSPIIGATILHAIRKQLSRPSEGLVSNYNLTIFTLAAEIRPVRHLLRLLEARTLHLQRIVLTNPLQNGVAGGPAVGGSEAGRAATAAQLMELTARVEQLECRSVTTEDLVAATGQGASGGAGESADAPESARARQREAILRDARIQMQPDVDALNRAVRRYEKKQTILAVQLDSRLQMLDSRLDDALSLAAHAAKNSTGNNRPRGRWPIWNWVVDQVTAAFLLPFRGAWMLVSLPWRVISAALGYDRRARSDKAPKGYRGGRSSRSSSTLAGGGDRFPARLSRR